MRHRNHSQSTSYDLEKNLYPKNHHQQPKPQLLLLPRLLSVNTTPSIRTTETMGFVDDDNVFDEETDFSLLRPPPQTAPPVIVVAGGERAAFTFNRSLSTKAAAELPEKNCRLRRFTVHSRDNFTNTWLNIHDFKKNCIKSNQPLTESIISMEEFKTSDQIESAATVAPEKAANMVADLKNVSSTPEQKKDDNNELISNNRRPPLLPQKATAIVVEEEICCYNSKNESMDKHKKSNNHSRKISRSSIEKIDDKENNETIMNVYKDTTVDDIIEENIEEGKIMIMKNYSSATTIPIDEKQAAATIAVAVTQKNKSVLYGMSRTSSLSSTSTNSNDSSSGTPSTLVIDHSERWIDNLDAKNSVIVALTVFYALIMTIFALVLELSHLLSGEDRRAQESKDLIFGLYMYGVSVIFLFYCYIVLLLNPRWNTLISKLKSWIRFRKYSSESSMTLDGVESSVAAATIHRKVTHDSPSAGSLFLRLGNVVFGIIGTVFYAFSAILCLSDKLCDKTNFAVDICAILFIFTQMHFVFCNWKMTIMGHHTIARFGTMHLVAANLWTWIRYVLIEESVMDKEIRHIFTDNRMIASLNLSEHEMSRNIYGDSGEDSNMGVGDFIQQKLASRIARSALTECSGSDYIDCVLGSVTDIMYTAIVEYSLIGAVVMFIVWRNIDHVRVTPTAYVKRKHQIRVDCSKTTSGLFAGLAFLAATFTSMAVFYGYSLIGRNQTAAFVFSITDIIQYVIASLACIYALYQMRQLRYFHSSDIRSNINPSQDLLDMILLSLGMIGEMIYSVAGLVGLTGDKTWQPLSVVLLTCHITRLMQVGLQCCLIYIALKLRIKGDLELRKKQPGKQVITFLLIANIAMFLMNLFESEKAGISETVVNFYGKKSWVFLVRSFSPLTIFYRFHSSVCLAEVWKNAYAWKD